MKNIIITFLSLIALVGIFNVSALSGRAAAFELVPTCSGNAANTTACKEVKAQERKQGENPFIRVITLIINVVSVLAGIFAVIGIMISSVKFIVAGGDSQGVAGARTTLIYSLAGILVVALAQSIVYFVLREA